MGCFKACAKRTDGGVSVSCMDTVTALSVCAAHVGANVAVLPEKTACVRAYRVEAADVKVTVPGEHVCIKSSSIKEAVCVSVCRIGEKVIVDAVRNDMDCRCWASRVADAVCLMCCRISGYARIGAESFCVEGIPLGLLLEDGSYIYTERGNVHILEFLEQIKEGI